MAKQAVAHPKRKSPNPRRAPKPDPIYAAIERRIQAFDALEAFCLEEEPSEDEKHPNRIAYEKRWDARSEADDDAVLEMVSTVPTTFEGLAALATAAIKLDDDRTEWPITQLLKTFRKAAKRLQTARA